MARRLVVLAAVVAVGLFAVAVGRAWPTVANWFEPASPEAAAAQVDPGPLPDDPAARLTLGVAAYDAEDYPRAWSILLPLAEAGEPEAQYRVGRMLSRGEGVRLDDRAAVAWYRMAADQDWPDGINALGYAYRRGKGVPLDKDFGTQLYRRAAEAGSAKGMVNYGTVQFTGNGGSQRLDRAEVWFRKAAELGNAMAMSKLGLVFDERGNREKYVYWTRQAGLNGRTSDWVELWFQNDPEALKRVGLREVVCSYWHNLILGDWSYQCECEACRLP